MTPLASSLIFDLPRAADSARQVLPDWAAALELLRQQQTSAAGALRACARRLSLEGDILAVAQVAVRVAGQIDSGGLARSTHFLLEAVAAGGAELNRLSNGLIEPSLHLCTILDQLPPAAALLPMALRSPIVRHRATSASALHSQLNAHGHALAASLDASAGSSWSEQAAALQEHCLTILPALAGTNTQWVAEVLIAWLCGCSQAGSVSSLEWQALRSTALELARRLAAGSPRAADAGVGLLQATALWSFLEHRRELAQRFCDCLGLLPLLSTAPPAFDRRSEVNRDALRGRFKELADAWAGTLEQPSPARVAVLRKAHEQLAAQGPGLAPILAESALRGAAVPAEDRKTFAIATVTAQLTVEADLFGRGDSPPHKPWAEWQALLTELARRLRSSDSRSGAAERVVLDCLNVFSPPELPQMEAIADALARLALHLGDDDGAGTNPARAQAVRLLLAETLQTLISDRHQAAFLLAEADRLLRLASQHPSEDICLAPDRLRAHLPSFSALLKQLDALAGSMSAGESDDALQLCGAELRSAGVLLRYLAAALPLGYGLTRAGATCNEAAHFVADAIAAGHTPRGAAEYIRAVARWLHKGLEVAVETGLLSPAVFQVPVLRLAHSDAPAVTTPAPLYAADVVLHTASSDTFAPTVPAPLPSQAPSAAAPIEVDLAALEAEPALPAELQAEALQEAQAALALLTGGSQTEPQALLRAAHTLVGLTRMLGSAHSEAAAQAEHLLLASPLPSRETLQSLLAPLVNTLKPTPPSDPSPPSTTPHSEPTPRPDDPAPKEVTLHAHIDDGVDLELLDVFMPEAADLTAQLERLCAPGKDFDARIASHALHTLKGGLRMVGLTTAGSLVHDAESLLLDDQLPEVELRTRLVALCSMVRKVCQDAQHGSAPASDSSTAASAPRPVARTAPRLDPSSLDLLSKRVAGLRISTERHGRAVASAITALTSISGPLALLKDLGARLNKRALEAGSGGALSGRVAASQAYAVFDRLELARYDDFDEIALRLQEIAADMDAALEHADGSLNRAHLEQRSRDDAQVALDQTTAKLAELPLLALQPRLAALAAQAATAEGKQVQLQIGETRVDRAILDALAPALEHLVRNAVCHGIETAEDRTRAGKPATGTISISASRQGAFYLVTCTDDGAGVRLESVQRKASRLGLIADGSSISMEEAIELIQLPSFSTRDEADQNAGRGVGLDAVVDLVRRVGGNVEMSCPPGQGLTTVCRLPTSLHRVQGLLLQMDAGAYVVPAPLIDRVVAVPMDAANLETCRVPHHGGERELRTICLQRALGVPAEPPRVGLLLRSGSGVLLAPRVEHVASLPIEPFDEALNGYGFLGHGLLADGTVAVVLGDVAIRRLAAPGAPQHQAHRVTVAPPRQSTVLVVDDSVTVRRAMTRWLTSLGLATIEAATGKEALEQLRSLASTASLPAAILSDIEMPVMDGFELLASVRAMPAAKTLPFAFISSRSGEKHRTYAIALGADLVLPKPASLEAIGAFLAHAGVPFDQQGLVKLTQGAQPLAA